MGWKRYGLQLMIYFVWKGQNRYPETFSERIRSARPETRNWKQKAGFKIQNFKTQDSKLETIS
jgi:hypothetical protein